MKTFSLLIILLLPCAVFAGTDCQILEYSTHYVVVCVGESEQTPTLTSKSVQGHISIKALTMAPATTPESEQKIETNQDTSQDLIPRDEQTFYSTNTPTSVEADPIPAKKKMKNGLARLHEVFWLKSRISQ